MVEGWRFCWSILCGRHYVRCTDVTEPSSRLRSGHSGAPFRDHRRPANSGQWFPSLTPISGFRPTTSGSLVNGLWFSCLSFSLTTALFAVLTKQWIHQYMAPPSGTPRDSCRVRQFRFVGLQQRRVGFTVGLLPVLMSTSLCIFLGGLVVFPFPLQASIASVFGSITSTSFAAHFIANCLPIIYPSCPYKTPLSQYIFPLYTCIAHNGFFA
ncbi:hypothetical protein ARMSODRAFT_93079 [Armillaria solidipes]|uniref:DUF6535 domain-containing protein n=1 Tax=Armillaria solidipes TaxID=1076256 RepID=A0A2H3C3U3_9AGAR|nr:hypothetical protein ARMSODRAFT_93079 [Armillaria solidipes]